MSTNRTGNLRRPVRPTGTRVSLSISPDLARRLERSPQVAKRMAEVVAEVAKLADDTCPVGDTETLKDSQETAVIIGRDGVAGIIAYTAFYAHIVHNGSVHSAPNPWLLNAALSVLVGRPVAAAA